MRTFSPFTKGAFTAAWPHWLVPRPVANLGRAVARGAARLMVALMISACARAEGFDVTSAPASVPSSTAPMPSAVESATPRASLPLADVPGEDLARLPRFPDAVRTAHVVSRDDVLRSVASGYLADSTVDEVRAFYQGVILEQGWQRADIDYDAGAWTYVLVDGGVEALIQLRPVDGLVGIDLRVSEPLATEPPAPVPAPVEVPGDGGGGGGGDGDDDDDDDDDDD
jgi:hypothetical protein